MQCLWESRKEKIKLVTRIGRRRLAGATTAIPLTVVTFELSDLHFYHHDAAYGIRPRYPRKYFNVYWSINTWYRCHGIFLGTCLCLKSGYISSNYMPSVDCRVRVWLLWRTVSLHIQKPTKEAKHSVKSIWERVFAFGRALRYSHGRRAIHAGFSRTLLLSSRQKIWSHAQRYHNLASNFWPLANTRLTDHIKGSHFHWFVSEHIVRLWESRNERNRFCLEQ